MSSHSRLASPIALGALIVCFPQTVLGQVRPAVAVDVTFAPQYEWRGLTRETTPVLQPSLAAALAWCSGFLTVGGWMNVGMADHQSSVEDFGLGQGIGESNVWLELAVRKGPFAFAGGYTEYRFDESAAALAGSTVFDTREVYARAEAHFGPVVPSAAVWYDVHRVDGAYVEVGTALRVPVLPVAVPTLYLEGLGAFSVGQDQSNGVRYFSANGLTHIDLSASTQVYLPVTGVFATLYVTPDVRLQINYDDATRRSVRDVDDRGSFTTWIGTLTLSWYL